MPKRRRSTRGRPPKKTKSKKEITEEQVEKPLPLIDFTLNEPDPVVEHLKEYSKIETSFKELSFDTILLDQIALEGLSGITIGRLFNIVEALFPNLPCTNDLDCQKYVWSILIRNLLNYSTSTARIRAFHLDPNGKPLQDYDNLKGIMIDKVIELPTQTVKRIAKSDSLLSPVQDGFIMGSCANYLSRIDITLFLINKSDNPMQCMHLLDVKFGLDNVYLVADQALRAKAILPDWADPNVDIKLREYCALELIGKSRSLGTVFPNDKALGRYRIMLEAKGFITQFQENMSSPIEHHLRRYANNQLINQSNSSTGVNMKSKTRAQDDRSDTSKAKQDTKNSSRKVKDEEEEEDDADSDSEEDDKDTDNLTLSALCFDASKLKPNRDVLSTVYDVIAESGGISQINLRRELHWPRFHLRNHLKNLISLEMVSTRPPKDGDGSLKNYFAPKASKRKKIKEEMLASNTGIMASWDEADLRAKKIIGHKRSSFSQAEDSILILCRITSVLIEPRLKLSWCVNKRLIRDLLHRELVEAHDKTSDACLRRIKYLKKLPNNIMSINELTAELQDDVDIKRLLRSKKLARRVNRRFLKLFKCVRSKIPNLLGITSSCTNFNCNSSLQRQVSSKTKTYAPTQRSQSLNGSNNGSTIGNSNLGASHNSPPSPLTATTTTTTTTAAATQEINDHEELRQKYDLFDCQSVASIQRPSTYEAPKNVVDVKLNQASLVTMAFTMTSCFGQFDERQRRMAYWLLDKFYSNFHDKLISSMLSKLNKRSLLTRKCPTTSEPLASSSLSTTAFSSPSSYLAKTRLSLKLNQSVLFLLNRYQSHSLIQLANPISRTYPIDLCESNEMGSIAMLTSLCSMSSFNLDMDLRIPTYVVGIDQGNENFKSLCEKVNPGTREILARFMSRCRGGSIPESTTNKLSSGKEETASKSSKDCNMSPKAASQSDVITAPDLNLSHNDNNNDLTTTVTSNPNKMDDSRRALFLLRHELKSHALDKCGSLADCLIVQPCNVKFYSNQRVELHEGVLERFLARSKPLEVVADGSQEIEKEARKNDVATKDAAMVVDQKKTVDETHQCDEEMNANSKQQLEAPVDDKWLVKGYTLSPASSIVTTNTTTTTTTATATVAVKPVDNSPEIDSSAVDEGCLSRGTANASSVMDRAVNASSSCKLPRQLEDEEDLSMERSFEARKRPIEFYARAWKQIDGHVHLETLFKLIESILSWLIVLPGVELGSLEREFCHLLPEENLHELLELMEELELICSERLRPPSRRPRLYGFCELEEGKEEKNKEASPNGREEGLVVVYESTANAYVKYCQLLSYCKPQQLDERR